MPANKVYLASNLSSFQNRNNCVCFTLKVMSYQRQRTQVQTSVASVTHRCIDTFKTDITLATIKATFSFRKLIPKNAQMTTLYINRSLYITFTMIYYIRQE